MRFHSRAIVLQTSTLFSNIVNVENQNVTTAVYIPLYPSNLDANSIIYITFYSFFVLLLFICAPSRWNVARKNRRVVGPNRLVKPSAESFVDVL